MEEQHKSKIVWVLFIIIVALVGLNIYQYYIANNMEEEIVAEVAVVETSATPVSTVSATPASTTTTIPTNWQEDTKTLINTYISSTLRLYGKPGGETLNERNGIANSVTLESSSSLTNYQKCVSDYISDPNKTDKYYPGGDYFNGVQAFATSFNIDEPTIDANNVVTVPVHEMFGSNDHTVNYYLIYENGNWVLDSTSELNKFASGDPHCQKQ